MVISILLVCENEYETNQTIQLRLLDFATINNFLWIHNKCDSILFHLQEEYDQN